MSSSGFNSRNLNYNANDSSLTPRTPRSRASGRPVTSFHDDEEEEYVDNVQGGPDEIDMLHTQAQEYPLLRSSASASFPAHQEDYSQLTRTPIARRERSPGRPRHVKTDPKSPDGKLRTLVDTAPLILGIIGAIILFILILLSFNRPEILKSYILKNGMATSTASSDETVHIDYSNHTVFPLEPIEYEQECWNLQDKGLMTHGHYWGMGGTNGNMHTQLDVPHQHVPGESAVCASTITYMLDGDVGLFFDLALLAQTAALARERNRTLIIDDSRWNRGEWTDYFQDVRKTQPGPEPGCLPPPPNELVACPRTARHWIVTQRTAKFHFGHGFSEHYEDAYQSDLSRQKPIYDHAAVSLKETILPSDSLRQELTQIRRLHANKPYVGMHIRHGDRYPANQKWRDDYVPITEYVKATLEAWRILRASHPREAEDAHPSVYVATDSYAAFQDHLALSPAPHNVWGLHAAANSNAERKWRWMASPHGYVQRVFMGRKIRPEERKRWTQGMVLDFAMLSGAWLEEGERAPGAVICTFTSNVCKMAAVSLGWERAFDRKLWMDVDWQGDLWPAWLGFEFK